MNLRPRKGKMMGHFWGACPCGVFHKHGCYECYSDITKFTERQKYALIRDTQVNHKLSELGYVVLRIREHEIVNKNTTSVNNIMNIIKTLTRKQIENK